MGHAYGEQMPEIARSAVRPRPRPGHSPFSGHLLALQRAAGNAAVSGLVARMRSGGVTVQRQSHGSGTGATISTSSETLDRFDTDSAVLTPAHLAVLARIAAQLNAEPLVFGGFVTVVGYADRPGSEAHNQELGQHRADAARSHLQGLITNPDTRREVRAYSSGEPAQGPAGATPGLRRVEITITRRGHDFRLRPPFGLTPGRARPALPATELLRRPSIPPEMRRRLPDWLLNNLPAQPVPPPVLNQLSQAVTRALGRRQIAELSGRLAAVIGLNRITVQRQLNQVLAQAGEAALRELLRIAIYALAGGPSGVPAPAHGSPIPPGSPFEPVEPSHGPAVFELPLPPIIRLSLPLPRWLQ
jgi:outer membrane protein OmpA-like peptidoglycan-associated protein